MIRKQLKLRHSSGACSTGSIEAQAIDSVDAVHIDSIVSSLSLCDANRSEKRAERVQRGLKLEFRARPGDINCRWLPHGPFYVAKSPGMCMLGNKRALSRSLRVPHRALLTVISTGYLCTCGLARVSLRLSTHATRCATAIQRA